MARICSASRATRAADVNAKSGSAAGGVMCGRLVASKWPVGRAGRTPQTSRTANGSATLSAMNSNSLEVYCYFCVHFNFIY
jgi:hypothetical protein